MEVGLFLSRSDLFSGFSVRECESLLSRTGVHLARYANQEIVYLQDQVCETLDVVIDGTISIRSLTEEGSVFKAQVLGPLDVLGATLLFGKGRHYPMQVYADSALQVLHIRRDVVLTLCEQDQRFLLALLTVISDRAHELSTTVQRLSSQTLREKLLVYFHHLAIQQHSSTITLPITKKELADRLGVARTSLSRELAHLVAERVLQYDKRVVQLHISSNS